jgi:hypothetical protein
MFGWDPFRIGRQRVTGGSQPVSVSFDDLMGATARGV